MHIDQLNWDDLKYFLVLSRTGSVSAAGRLLSVKHTTVSRRIQMLESQLGARLFDRSHQGYRMTPMAEALLEQVEHVETCVRQIYLQASGQDTQLSGRLNLTVAYELANRLLIPYLNRFCERYPQIDLQLMMSKALLDLSAVEADLAIRMTATPPEALVGRELSPLRHGIYGVDSLLARFESPSVALQKVPVILFEDELSPPDWVEQHFPNAKVVMRVDDVGSMAAAVRSGMGLAKLPCLIGDTEPQLKRLRLPISPSRWGIWLLHHPDLRNTAKVQACKSFLMALFEEHAPLIQGQCSNYADLPAGMASQDSAI